MRKLASLTCIATLASLAAAQTLAGDTALPARMTAEDMSGAMFEREDTTRTERNGHTVLDVTSLSL